MSIIIKREDADKLNKLLRAMDVYGVEDGMYLDYDDGPKLAEWLNSNPNYEGEFMVYSMEEAIGTTDLTTEVCDAWNADDCCHEYHPSPAEVKLRARIAELETFVHKQEAELEKHKLALALGKKAPAKPTKKAATPRKRK